MLGDSGRLQLRVKCAGERSLFDMGHKQWLHRMTRDKWHAPLKRSAVCGEI